MTYPAKLSIATLYSGAIINPIETSRRVATAETFAMAAEIVRRWNMHDDLVGALRDMQRVVDMLMPGVRHIAVQDYALLNDAPFRASALIARETEEST